MRFTPDDIRKLEPDEIFVFGSNTSGRHGKGAAKTAMKWGARYGKGEGLYGQTYALPTCDGKFKALLLGNVTVHIMRFFKCALKNPDKTFLVTKVGCGLAGRGIQEIAIRFFNMGPIPANVILPQEFWAYQPK